MPGRLERIWIKDSHGGNMNPAESVTLVTGKGVTGDANYDGRRQVTLIDAARWEQVDRELGVTVDPGNRRANILLSGVSLAETVGRTLNIGATRLLVRGETRPCNLMDEMHPGLQEALKADWGGGVWGDVISGGEIRVGDPVAWEDAVVA